MTKSNKKTIKQFFASLKSDKYFQQLEEILKDKRECSFIKYHKVFPDSLSKISIHNSRISSAVYRIPEQKMKCSFKFDIPFYCIYYTDGMIYGGVIIEANISPRRDEIQYTHKMYFSTNITYGHYSYGHYEKELPLDTVIDKKNLLKIFMDFVREHWYTEGVLHFIQRRIHSHDKDIVKTFYLRYKEAIMQYNSNEKYDEFKSLSKIMKRFRLVFPTIHFAQKYLSQLKNHPKLSKLPKNETIQVDTADHSWFNTFDGDIDQLEDNFWKQYDGSEDTIII